MHKTCPKNFHSTRIKWPKAKRWYKNNNKFYVRAHTHQWRWQQYIFLMHKKNIKRYLFTFPNRIISSLSHIIHQKITKKKLINDASSRVVTYFYIYLFFFTLNIKKIQKGALLEFKYIVLSWKLIWTDEYLIRGRSCLKQSSSCYMLSRFLWVESFIMWNFKMISCIYFFCKIKL